MDSMATPEIDHSFDAKDGDTYAMDGSCSNCHAKYRVKLKKGHEAPSWVFPITCPHCGCRAVRCYP